MPEQNRPTYGCQNRRLCPAVLHCQVVDNYVGDHWAAQRNRYRNHHVSDFINTHFRADYRPFAENIYKLHRNSLVHSWNLFEATIYPDDTKIRSEGGTVAFGLVDFFTVLVSAAEDFLNSLAGDATLQNNALLRYTALRETAKS